MKYTKLISTLLALLLIVGLFAACGGEKDDETKPGVTLPTIDAPAGTGNNTAESNASTQGSQTGSGRDPFAETKKWEPDSGEKGDVGEGSNEGNPGGVRDPEDGQTPGENQPDPSGAETQPTPSQSGASLSDDSGEDMVVVTTEYPDDSDEDLG